MWYADSAATVHVSSNRSDFSMYHKYEDGRDIKAFGNNTVKGVGEGDIIADITYGDKTTRIQLTQVMHVPNAGGKILSLKVLAQKGFESHIVGNHIQIVKDAKIHTEAVLGGELYEVKMSIVPPQDSILAAVKRDSAAADLSTWHRRLGHLGDTMLKKLVESQVVKGMDITDTHLGGICKDCILGKMDEKPFESRKEHDSCLFGTYMPT